MFHLPFSLKSRVDPEKFLVLWPIYSKATQQVPELEDGRKPTTLLDFPQIHGIKACRNDMLRMQISAMEAPSYGSRLSLVQTVMNQPDIASEFKEWITITETGPVPSEKLLRAIAISKIDSQQGLGVMLNFDDLKANLREAKNAVI